MTTEGEKTHDFDFTDPATGCRMYEYLSEERQRCPVLKGTAHGGYWALANYADVTKAAHDYETFSTADGVSIPRVTKKSPSYPLEVDPPDHGKYRKVLQPYFSPRAVQQHEPQIRRIVREYIADFAPRGEVELMAEFASPIPAVMLALLLGIERQRWSDLRTWTEGMLDAASRGDREAGLRSGSAMFDFLVEETELRKTHPADDLLTAIAKSSIDGESIRDEVRWGMAQLLMLAGHETTVNGIGNLFHHLAERPELCQQVRADAAARRRVIDESLRYEAPVFGLARTLVHDTTVSGVDLAEGDRVLLMFGAANRDPAQFSDPDRFDPDRPNNRQHVAFGSGRHRCLGEHLALLELDIVLQEFLAVIPTFRLAPGAEIMMSHRAARGPISLPLVWSV